MEEIVHVQYCDVIVAEDSDFDLVVIWHHLFVGDRRTLRLQG